MQQLPILRDVNMDSLQEKVQDVTANSASYALRFASNGAAIAVRIITGVVLTIYFILEGDEAYAWFLSLFPVERRLRLDQTLARASARMGRWLLGQGTLMLILGVLSTIVFALLHVRYAYALGVIMGLFNIVPVAGALVSVSVVVLVAALDSWSRVAGVLIFYFTYLQDRKHLAHSKDHAHPGGSRRPHHPHRPPPRLSAGRHHRSHGRCPHRRAHRRRPQ